MNMLIKPIHSSQLFDEQVQLFKLLAHPARLAILETLRHGEECVCHMEATLGYRQAYLSQQLAILREAGIIQDRRDGWNIFYRVTKPDIFHILDAVNELEGQPSNEFTQRLISPDCPCPKCSGNR
jgi:ArsR family transcriptional regulator